MGLFSCACPCWPRPPPTIHSAPEQPDERTPLITDPPQITHSPHLPVVDTAQQLANEAAAQTIVNQTVRCLVDVYSQAPFSHLRIQGTHPPKDVATHHTPDGSCSTWRAYDPPNCAATISGYADTSGHSEMPSTPKPETNATHQRSFHSLKTIVNHQPRANPEGTQDTPSRPHSPPNSIAHTSCSTQFNTITSFQTARDHSQSDSDLASLPHSNQVNQHPEFVRNLWNSSPDSSSPHLPSSVNIVSDPDLLTDDPKQLSDMVSNGFQLKDPGPIIVDL